MTNKIDTNSVFYPGNFTEEQKAHIKKSPLWPLIVSMHFNHNGVPLLSKYQDYPRPGTEVSKYRATFSHRIGFPILAIECRKSATGAAYEIWRKGLNSVGEPIDNSLSECVRLMASSKSQYLLGQMRKGRILDDIAKLHKKCEEGVITEAMRTVIIAYADQLNPVNQTCPTLNTEAQKWAAMVATKRADIIEIPPETRLVMEQISNYYADVQTKYDLFTKEVNEMYAADKWVVNFMKDFGYVVGKLSGAPLVERTIERRNKGSTHLKPHHLVWSIYPSFYASLDDMPEPHRTELMAALNHAKIHRAGSRVHVDPAQLIAAGMVVQREVYAITHAMNSTSTWVMVDA